MRRRGHAPDPRLGSLKLRAIDIACGRFEARSVADLGAVWAVDAGYSFYALDRYDLNRVVICDDNFTPPVLDRQREDERVELVQGDFGSEAAAEQVGSVDALILFDVLLHQVGPDWDEVLDRYAPRTPCFVLAGPWWNGEGTVRLLDLGPEEYLSVVPERELHAEALTKLDEVNPARGKPWRDVHDIWQWGITDADLRTRLERLGFKLVYHENLGSWQGLPAFDDSSYVFVKQPG
jgi:hypothetical protein